MPKTGAIKIFGIGMGRTGTSSLCRAFVLLGFKAVHYPTPEQFERIEEYQFANDFPITTRYKELDKKFPNSKFIYTVRDMDDWIASTEKLYNERKAKKYKCPWVKDVSEMLGFNVDDYSIEFDKKVEKYKQAYLKHDLDVKNYFIDRPDDLLILNIFNENSWEKLARFIGLSKTPKIPFPCINTSLKKNTKMIAKLIALMSNFCGRII